MLTIAYLANQFPSPVEPYVTDEIEELRGRGVHVIAGSVRCAERQRVQSSPQGSASDQVVLQPLQLLLMLRALWLCARNWPRIADLLTRVVFGGKESPLQRGKALVHTWLGAYYALQLEARDVSHIHVHHGYFGSWIAMVAARLLAVDFSMTLHGSDVLLHKSYLDTKLKNCRFCVTVSEYNRRYILEHYPEVVGEKILVARLGVDAPEHVRQYSYAPSREATSVRDGESEFRLLSVGRLHAVKDHAFLLRACAEFRARGFSFECSIAGDGPERSNLEALIRKYELESRVRLLGHVPREEMGSLYDRAGLVVLTSRSEGIPLVLMEAMACGKLVLAPAITGIPELVIADKTGFLYEPGSLGNFVEKLVFIHSLMRTGNRADHPNVNSAARQLDWVRHAARVQVHHSFNRKKNLESFGDLFLQRIATQTGDLDHEDLVLQQI